MLKAIGIRSALIGVGSAFALLFCFTPNTASACACGCSVFDVGFGGLPQEDNHGGRVYFEVDHSDQTRNWIGTSKADASLNNDKRLNTTWYNVGFEYMFNREWGVAAKIPYVTRGFSTLDDDGVTIDHLDSRSIGDVELMGMYTGFASDMSLGLMFGLKLPTGTFMATGFDRDSQIGTGSTDLMIGGFKRGMITGDNAWQYFTQVMARIPFAYQSALDPDSGLSQTYKPGYQVDGTVGIVYNNGYNILGFDKIAPIFQLIGSHRVRDGGDAADPLNSGFDRLMIAPGIEFTKVVDEFNKRVVKFYFDVEVPVYYRTNAAVNDDGSEGQLIAPVMYKLVASYNF
ncbi:MAG TPA: hypothetical protein VMT22_12840 [Terriglobales bacterium]|nr:hypothetical protein [Terriglobales bacterium]